MRIEELLKDRNPDLFNALKDFIPLAKEVLKLKSLPKIKLVSKVDDKQQPTFGKFINSKNVVHVAVKDRHVLDILRTLAHELAHYKQNVENRLNPRSGETGSPEENEAHTYAGIIMRNFNKSHPQYFDVSPVELEEDWKKKLGTAALIGAGILGINNLKQQKPTAEPPSIIQRAPEEVAKLPTPFENHLKNSLFSHGIRGTELAQFLAQVAHETANYNSLEELPDDSGNQYFYKKYWYNKRVREILGNIQKEDAVNFKGRGLFHLTGRYNYDACGKALGIDLLKHPELAASANYQIPIAIWYWKTRVSRKLGPNADFSNTANVTYYINKNAGPRNISRRDSLFRDYYDMLNLDREDEENKENDNP